jgi:hypothetical protein
MHACGAHTYLQPPPHESHRLALRDFDVRWFEALLALAPRVEGAVTQEAKGRRRHLRHIAVPRAREQQQRPRGVREEVLQPHAPIQAQRVEADRGLDLGECEPVEAVVVGAGGEEAEVLVRVSGARTHTPTPPHRTSFTAAASP